MPGFGITGFRRRNVGIHRVEAAPPGREVIDSQDQVVGEGWSPVLIKERVADGQLSYAGGDPEVPVGYHGQSARTFEPLAITLLPGGGESAESEVGSYVNVDGETRTGRFIHKAMIPMQLGQLNKLHGWRQDTELDDIAWPYRLIAGIDYSGPAHPQHSNVWQLPPDMGVGQGNYDQFVTQTPLYPVDLATAIPPDHAFPGDMFGIIGPNEHA